MDKDLLFELKKLSDEELKIKDGIDEINKEIYMSNNKSNEIDAKKLLEKGKLITLRPHTRFVNFPMHTHNYIELVYMCAGSTKHIINGTEIILEEGDLLFLSQSARQEIKKASEDDICINFIILPEFFDTTLDMLGREESQIREFIIDCLKNKNSEIPYILFRVSKVLPVQNLVENLIWTLLNKQQNKRSVNKITMGLLILQLQNHLDKIETSVDNVEQEIIFKTYEYIEENYREGELSELAKKLNYEISWLSRKIKVLTGQTYTELVHTKRLNQTAFLLAETKLSIYDIGYLVGYNNISYFYRIFRKKFGVSPKEYRQNSNVIKN